MRASLPLFTKFTIATAIGVLLLGCSDSQPATDPDPEYSPALSVERTTWLPYAQASFQLPTHTR